MQGILQRMDWHVSKVRMGNMGILMRMENARLKQSMGKHTDLQKMGWQEYARRIMNNQGMVS